MAMKWPRRSLSEIELWRECMFLKIYGIYFGKYPIPVNTNTKYQAARLLPQGVQDKQIHAKRAEFGVQVGVSHSELPTFYEFLALCRHEDVSKNVEVALAILVAYNFAVSTKCQIRAHLTVACAKTRN